ncbi:MAG: HAD family hydrolase [Patescibacteria group bacterium]
MSIAEKSNLHPDFVLPRNEGLLTESVRIPGTNIEIVRPFDGTRITTALFDFDGTLSLERNGWIKLMIANNTEVLLEAVPGLDRKEATEWVTSDIAETIGIPTYMQMKRLASEIARRGGTAKDSQDYKNSYTEKLVEMVGLVYEKIANDQLSIEDVVVKGAFDLLREFKLRFGNNLYLASGTDIEPVKQSVARLGFDEFFDEDRIIAAGSLPNPETDAKKIIIDHLMSQKHLEPGQLLCFGDGFPEILYAYRAGGICVGVLTSDFYEGDSNYFTMEGKRQRLLNAGTHILIPDFRQTRLIEVALSKFP